MSKGTLTIEGARRWYPADATHGFEHILQVLRLAEAIARQEGADWEIVQAAALLHDATPEVGDQPTYPRPLPEGRGEKGEGEGSQHSGAGRREHHLNSADFARQVLQAEGWPEGRIAAVQHCIRAHRFRDDRENPQTLEAQVLFDADKLDAIGARGVARALSYAQAHGQPAYARPSPTFLSSGQPEAGEPHSAYHEYVFKLVKLKDRLYTPTGRALAEARHQVMVAFFESLRAEMERF